MSGPLRRDRQFTLPLITASSALLVVAMCATNAWGQNPGMRGPATFRPHIPTRPPNPAGIRPRVPDNSRYIRQAGFQGVSGAAGQTGQAGQAGQGGGGLGGFGGGLGGGLGGIAGGGLGGGGLGGAGGGFGGAGGGKQFGFGGTEPGSDGPSFRDGVGIFGGRPALDGGATGPRPQLPAPGTKRTMIRSPGD